MTDMNVEHTPNRNKEEHVKQRCSKQSNQKKIHYAQIKVKMLKHVYAHHSANKIA